MTGQDRFWSKSARGALASRFGLPAPALMQDWEWEVADTVRFHEFLSAYTPALPDDQRFSLMEILVQCVDDCASETERLVHWGQVHPLLEKNRALHSKTISYGSCLDAELEDEMFHVSPLMRRLLE